MDEEEKEEERGRERWDVCARSKKRTSPPQHPRHLDELDGDLAGVHLCCLFCFAAEATLAAGAGAVSCVVRCSVIVTESFKSMMRKGKSLWDEDAATLDLKGVGRIV